MLERSEVIEAIQKALMDDRELLTWEGSIRTWSGKRVQVLNWDYRRMAQTAYDAATEMLLGYEPADATSKASGGVERPQTAPATFPEAASDVSQGADGGQDA